MNHKDLINAIAAQKKIDKVTVHAVLDELSIQISAQLNIDGQINLHGIGTLQVVETAARKGRNPQTGAEIDIPAGKRIKLKAAKVLKDAIA